MKTLTKMEIETLKQTRGIEESDIGEAEEVAILFGDLHARLCMVADKYGMDRDEFIRHATLAMTKMAIAGSSKYFEIPEHIKEFVERN